jgi:hypothetical protein
MITQRLPSSMPRVPRMRGKPVNELAATDRVGRVIQISLAIYLIPVLLVVAVVTGVAMTILGISQTIYGVCERGRHIIRGGR